MQESFDGWSLTFTKSGGGWQVVASDGQRKLSCWSAGTKQEAKAEMLEMIREKAVQ